MRRCRPLADDVAEVARRFKLIETSIALLDRVRPLNLSGELQRVRQAFVAGGRAAPAFQYARRADLSGARRELSQLLVALEAGGGDAEHHLLAERAQELELEASLVEHVAEPGFADLACQRFPLPKEPSAVRTLAEQFSIAAPGENSATPDILHDSGDARDPKSLWSELQRRLQAERFAVRVELVVGLVSLAAVADGVVRVRAGAQLTERVARRIALHEVEGHVRPRAVGERLGGVFTAGSRGASEDEEGRAILLEERAGLLDGTRRKELAWRYWAADSLRSGAEFADTVTLLGQRGAALDVAVELAGRVHRGGGLGRESIYLAGYQRVATAFARRPELERVVASGRISLDAAQALLAGSIELDDDGDVV